MFYMWFVRINKYLCERSGRKKNDKQFFCPILILWRLETGNQPVLLFLEIYWVLLRPFWKSWRYLTKTQSWNEALTFQLKHDIDNDFSCRCYRNWNFSIITIASARDLAQVRKIVVCRNKSQLISSVCLFVVEFKNQR